MSVLVDKFNNILDRANINNQAPVFHKPIDQHIGIQVSGRFSTTDDTPAGQMCYITVARNPLVIMPHDGYGIAWRKQPQFLINAWNAYLTNSTSTVSAADQEKFNQMYAHIFGNGPLTPINQWWADLATNTRPALPQDKQLLKYNVYLIDTDILQEDVYVTPEAMWSQTGGKNQFLVAAKMWIEPNTWYEYHLKIYEKLGFEGWIYNSENPPADPLSIANRLLDRGQTYPPYVAKARYWGEKDLEKTGYMGGLAGGHFGIGIENTKNCEWLFDNLLIKSFIETFPMHLFKFKPGLNDFPDSGPLTVEYFGVGYDPELWDRDKAGHSFTRVWIRNHSESKWEPVGHHYAEVDDSRETQKLLKTFEPLSKYKDSSGQVHVLAHAANSGPKPGLAYDIPSGTYKQATAYNPETGQEEIVTKDFSADANHFLSSYYVSINNANLQGVHRGNTLDIYCFDPDNIVLATSEVTLTEDILYTSMVPAFPGYMVELVEIRQKLSQVILDPAAYTVTNQGTGTAYSGGSTANYKIQFIDQNLAGLRLELVYKYMSTGGAMQTFIESDANRAPGSDVMIKAMPCYMVELDSLVYSDGPAPTAMRSALITYINKTVETRLDRSDIINFMYAQGATYVNTDFDILITGYNENFVKEETIVDQAFILPTDKVGRFFTDSTKLIGVLQQGIGFTATSATSGNVSAGGGTIL